ncbi:MAG: histidine kinase [Gemmatimonadetes bacterium]|nr:histidine kinase [Gemmatimonadota bacterium]
MRKEQSIWRIVITILRSAPTSTKVFLIPIPILLILLTVGVVLDLVASGRPTAGVQVWSLILGNAGLLMWSLAAVLHAASESKPGPLAQATANDLFRRIWRHCLQFTARFRPDEEHKQLNDIVLVLPIIGVTAGCLLAVAAGILLPSTPSNPLLLVPVLLYAIFVMMAVRTVSDTMRFLHRYAHEKADVAAQAQTLATEAQLSALQAQINPHFLFNALNTVASLVRTDPRAAEATVDNLAQVLRRTLDRSRCTMSTVDDEVDYLKAYLSVEKERYGDRLTVEWSIDERTRMLRIPPMTLQPLVENSLKHGIGGRLHGGTLAISAAVEHNNLVLRVADDGAGFMPQHREGTGLRNLRERIATLYGDEGGVLIGGDGEGATVTVHIPLNGEEAAS